MTLNPNQIHYVHPKLEVLLQAPAWPAPRIRRTRITIAYQIQYKGVLFGVSFCSPNDCFDKARGRRDSLTRLIDEGFFIPTRERSSVGEADRLCRVIIEFAAFAQNLALPGVPSYWIKINGWVPKNQAT